MPIRNYDIENKREYDAERRADLKARGLCGCQRPLAEGKSQCQRCLDRGNTRQKRIFQERIDAGLCRRCGLNKITSTQYCEICKPKRSIENKNKIKQIKAEVFNAYGGIKCAWCGIEDIDVLAIDHINGGGNKERKALGMPGGGYKFYMYLKENSYPSGYQVLCMNCNLKKHLQGNRRVD